MNKKGFTLMELLAVIVLLAIIATIAIPIFLKAISKSKETSFERRAPIENYDTYNLEVEENHNYIVNGVVAHNAQKCE